MKHKTIKLISNSSTAYQILANVGQSRMKVYFGNENDARKGFDLFYSHTALIIVRTLRSPFAGSPRRPSVGYYVNHVDYRTSGYILAQRNYSAAVARRAAITSRHVTHSRHN